MPTYVPAPDSQRTDDMTLHGRLPDLTDPFVENLRRSLRERHLVSRGSRVLVACSGGADSTALAAAMRVLAEPLGLTLAVGHVNHRIRGGQACDDARWVVEFAGLLGLPCLVGSADVPSLKTIHGGSLEDVARRARWALLNDMRASLGADVIATAHHSDDQAETVLMHAMRGSGLAGISGMTWGPRGGTIRPLLATGRDDIREALVRWGMPWREDASNETRDHARNRVRHELLPALERDWNPRIGRALSRLAESAALDGEALDEIAEQAMSSAVIRQSNQAIVLDCSAIREYPMAIRRRVVRRAALGLPTVEDALTYAETERLEALTTGRGTVALRGRLLARSNGRRLWCESADAWRGPTSIALDGETAIPGWGAVVARRDSPRRAVGANALRWPVDRWASQPPSIRRWCAGDRITVRGEGHPALVADLAHASPAKPDPRELLVVEDAARIVWIPGVARARPPRAQAGTPTALLQWVEAE